MTLKTRKPEKDRHDLDGRINPKRTGMTLTDGFDQVVYACASLMQESYLPGK
jgi:hypothetical protein